MKASLAEVRTNKILGAIANLEKECRH